MSYNYTLRYKTFDQLISEVQSDFETLNLEGFILNQQLIKVAKRINYDLGLRIFQTKEAILEVEKGRVKLPDDFYVLNFALICDEFTVNQGMPQGTWIEERPFITPYQETNPNPNSCTNGPVNCSTCQQVVSSCNCVTPAACSTGLNTTNPSGYFGDPCIKPRVFLNCKNEKYELVQIVNTGETRTYKRLIQIRIINNAQSIDCDCPNLYWNTPEKAWIKDNYLYTSFDCGKVYINYQGMLEDDDGNLLVPDHDMLNEYYEYGLKQRVIENLIMNDDERAMNKLQLIEQRYRAARNYALSIVNTPNWSEFKQVWEMNRRAQYAKYYDMFKSFPQFRNDPRTFRRNV
jgi:hypothetical protein